MTSRVALLVALLGASACASTPSARGQMLGEADLSRPLRAVGTEPFWGVEFTGSELRLSIMGEQHMVAPQPRPGISAGTAVYRSRSRDGEPVLITLSAEDCSDGMSDRTYPLTAVVQWGASTHHGCAATLSALEKTSDFERAVD